MIITSHDINYKDPLIKSLENYFTKKGIEYVNITEEIESERGIRFSKENLLVLEKKFEIYDSSLFWRIPKIEIQEVNEINEFEIFNFNKFINYYIEFLSQSSNSMVKHPYSSQAENKLIQHKLAHTLGFKVPKTFIGNDKSEVLDWFDDKVIFKPLQSHGVGNNSFIGPTIINRQELSELTILSLPGIFQNFIEKKYEVRIALWVNDYASCKIDQKSGDYGFDWRVWPKDEFHIELFTPPDSLISRCRKMLQCLNLNFGVFDFIKGKDGNLYFLEVNPAGSYLFIELYCPACKVFEKTIDFLLRKKIHPEKNISLDSFYVE